MLPALHILPTFAVDAFKKDPHFPGLTPAQHRLTAVAGKQPIQNIPHITRSGS
jgi:hypothetical protein